MKKIIYSIALGALTLTNTSCYDVLDKEPLDQYTDAVVWNDPTLSLSEEIFLFDIN